MEAGIAPRGADSFEWWLIGSEYHGRLAIEEHETGRPRMSDDTDPAEKGPEHRLNPSGMRLPSTGQDS